MKLGLEKLEKWAESLPDDKVIDFLDNNNCVICQFIRDTTGMAASASATNFYVYPSGIPREGEVISRRIEPEIIEILIKARNPSIGEYSNDITKERLLNAIRKVKNEFTTTNSSAS